MGSCLTNKYSEGFPGARYYGGAQYVDQIENLCRERALQAFSLNPSEWAVNVQPYAVSTAMLSVYTALLKPGEVILEMDESKNASNHYFKSVSYGVNKDSGVIDYEFVKS